MAVDIKALAFSTQFIRQVQFRNEACYYPFLLRSDFQCITCWAVQPVEGTVWLKELNPIFTTWSPPIFGTVKISEVHAVVQIDTILVEFSEGVINKNIVVSGYECYAG